MRGLALAALLTLVALPALGQEPTSEWREIKNAEAGFAIQFPAAPTTSRTTYRLGDREPVPASVYTLKEPGEDLTLTVADFFTTQEDRTAIVDEALKALARDGEIKLNVEAHVDLQFGRTVSIGGKDGGRTLAAAFFVDRRLYLVSGRASPPDAEERSDRIARFVETLSLPDHEPDAVTD